MNYHTQKLKEDIVVLINESKLPAVNVRLILGELYDQIREIEEDFINREKAQAIKELEASKRENEDEIVDEDYQE